MSLQVRYSKFALPSLKAGFVDALWERGAARLTGSIQFTPFKGDGYKYNVEKEKPGLSAARNPYSYDAPPGGVGDFHNVIVKAGQLVRDFDTPVYAQSILTSDNDQLAINAKMAARKMSDEVLFQMMHGDGSWQDETGVNLCGFDWYLDNYAGHKMTGGYAAKYYSPEFAETKFFATTSGNPDHVAANQQTFSQTMVDDLISRVKAEDGSGVFLISRRRPWIEFKRLLNASGGNTAQMLINDRMVNAWDSHPWIVSDTVGKEKSSAAGGSLLTGSLSTLTVASTGADVFIGFSDLDVGRVVTVTGANFSAAGGHSASGLAANQTRIATVISRTQVGVQFAAGAQVTGAAVTVLAKDNVIYAVTPQLVQAIYAGDNSASESTYNNDAGEYYGTIAGFDILDLGMLQAGGAINRHRALWQGNFVVEQPFSLARISDFKFQ
jgi:hypothetical protein